LKSRICIFSHVPYGPFAESKEHVGGFILIEAAGMDEALEIAAGIPLTKLGSIEVRPIMRIGG